MLTDLVRHRLPPSLPLADENTRPGPRVTDRLQPECDDKNSPRKHFTIASHKTFLFPQFCSISIIIPHSLKRFLEAGCCEACIFIHLGWALSVLDRMWILKKPSNFLLKTCSGCSGCSVMANVHRQYWFLFQLNAWAFPHTHYLLFVFYRCSVVWVFSILKYNQTWIN